MDSLGDPDPAFKTSPILSSIGRIGVGIHDSRAGGGSRTAGEEVQGEEQDQEGGANDQPKPHCSGGEFAVQFSMALIENIVRLLKLLQVGKDEALSTVLKNVVVPGGGHYQGFNPILDKLRQEEVMRLKEQVAFIAILPPYLT